MSKFSFVCSIENMGAGITSACRFGTEPLICKDKNDHLSKQLWHVVTKEHGVPQWGTEQYR